MHNRYILVSGRDSAHNFSVKSTSVCVAIEASLAGEIAAIFQHVWSSISGENYTALLHEVLLTTLMEQQTVTNPAVMHGLCAMTKQWLSKAFLAHARLPHHLISRFVLETNRLVNNNYVSDHAQYLTCKVEWCLTNGLLTHTTTWLFAYWDTFGSYECNYTLASTNSIANVSTQNISSNSILVIEPTSLKRQIRASYTIFSLEGGGM